MTEAVIAADHRTIVGESPVWDARRGRLFWVDIIGKAILSLNPENGLVETTPTEDFPTAIGLCESPEKAVIAFAGGVSIWEIGTDRFEPFATLDDEPEGNRLNEGAVGPDGAFWVGTMQSNLNPDGSMRDMDRSSGALYRVSPSGAVRRVTAQSFGISNTLVWDEPRGTMYFGDTLAQTLYRFPWPLTGDYAPWAVTKDHGFPDGSAIDEEGYVWNARYAGGRLLRYAPDGTIDRQLPLPATNITACTFGGPDRRTLYVTTATNQLAPDRLENPAEGALLALDVGVAGPPSYLFGI